MTFRTISKRPVLLVGNGVRSSGASDLLIEFARKTDIPVITTMNAVDLVQDDLKLGFFGVYGNRVANMIVKSSDYIISIGARLGLRQIGNIKEFFAPYAHLLRVDIDENELTRVIKPDEEDFLMDARRFLEILSLESIPRYTEWKNRCFETKKVLDDYDKEEGNLCIEAISSLLPHDPVVTVDVGQNLCWAAQSFTLKGQNGRLIIGGSYGSMGCALPFAIGASIANKGQKVFCITGDGGLQMNIQELETVVRERLPIKVLVLNNHVLGKISEIQRNSYNGMYAQTTAESGYTVPSFCKIANAYGIKATKLDNYENIDDYAGWLNDDEPCLIDIRLSADSNLIPKVNWNSDDIKPELDKNVLNKVENILYGVV